MFAQYDEISRALRAVFGRVVMAELDGDISLMAVPAEELVELEYRNRLRQEGRIFFLAGKQEPVSGFSLFAGSWV